jgi:hypothetical protein
VSGRVVGVAWVDGVVASLVGGVVGVPDDLPGAA